MDFGRELVLIFIRTSGMIVRYDYLEWTLIYGISESVPIQPVLFLHVQSHLYMFNSAWLHYTKSQRPKQNVPYEVNLMCCQAVADGFERQMNDEIEYKLKQWHWLWQSMYRLFNSYTIQTHADINSILAMSMCWFLAISIIYIHQIGHIWIICTEG